MIVESNSNVRRDTFYLERIAQAKSKHALHGSSYAKDRIIHSRFGNINDFELALLLPNKYLPNEVFIIVILISNHLHTPNFQRE